MWVLFEAGLVASRFFIKKRDDEDAAEEEAEPAAETSSASAASAGQAADTHGAAVAYPDDYVEPTDEEMEQDFLALPMQRGTHPDSLARCERCIWLDYNSPNP